MPTKKISPYLFVGFSSIIGFIFYIFPELDLITSSLFTDPETSRFIYARQPFLLFLYETVYLLSGTVIIVTLLLLIISYLPKINTYTKVSAIRKRHLIYVLLCVALGPGLVVNAIFKDQWGRARPHQIEYFQGDKIFTPAFVMTDQCPSNCSFVSGHASMGFFFYTFGFLFVKRRLFFWGLGTGLGTLFGSARIIQGSHFLSDVIFSGIFVFTVCYLLHYYLYMDGQLSKSDS